MGGRQPHRGGTELRTDEQRRASAAAGGEAVRHWAEELAERALVSKGFEVLGRNHRVRGGEIDLVVRAADGTVVFVEVRQRRSAAFGGAGASITPSKQRRVRRAAAHYLATVLRRTDVPVRFDAMLILGEGPRARLSHVEDAF